MFQHLKLAALGMALAVAPAMATSPKHPSPVQQKAVWTDAKGVDLKHINHDLKHGVLTANVVIYMPTNFDAAFNKISLPKMLEGFAEAKAIFGQAGVQLKLQAVREGAINKKYLHIQANEIPRVPDTEYLNSYESSARLPTELSALAKEAFEHIIEPSQEAHRTIYLIGLQDVIMPFIGAVDERNWTVKMVRTGGLSFPSYSYGPTMPYHLRGVMTISNLSTPNRLARTIAHELGHKLINVSHEYRDIDPAHEVNAEGGLMLYGNGTAIEAGKAGRYHKERLHLSPFLYRTTAKGEVIWNADYEEGGHYYDPIYSKNVVHFAGAPSKNPNW